ncbi:unnamed protein product [Zymoseptoria tritici ST99CH_1A5]|uniref:Protein PBN1 n=1 Tax=Zymoseptoria tritici ST99CH_1A5 TaxID=1276529 RepID=A0A1Y6LRE3_ZYMTR|nr:unnamed protein product [Zymoseptoria tritici ST99CH_1A5]
MRQRVTYLLPAGTGVDPADIELADDALIYAKSSDAAEERRITIGLSDLPQELQLFLDDFHELHIRLVSSQNYNVSSPAVSRLPSGLHIFFTPRTSGAESKLCSYLKLLLQGDAKCDASLNSFTKPSILSERFASASTYQFYHASSDISQISTELAKKLCPVAASVKTMQPLCEGLHRTKSAAYVDYDFDAISHALNVVVMWEQSTTNLASVDGQTGLRKITAEDRLEVGVLALEKADEPEEISLGGYLTVVGEDDHPSATLFSFPARHHPLPSGDDTTFSAKFQQPTGLHPKLEITFSSRELSPPKDSCALHAYWTLPSYLFIDRYQLSDSLFLDSQNLVSLRSLDGEQDLEAPDWVIRRWGSSALLELAHTKVTDTAPSKNDWIVTVPTHLRYISSTSTGLNGSQVHVPWPVIFWACEAEEGLKMATNPFDRVNLGYDGLFGPKTMFYHVPPAGKELMERLTVPTLNADQTGWVPFGTAVAVLLGFGWVMLQLLWPKAPAQVTAAARNKTE